MKITVVSILAVLIHLRFAFAASPLVLAGSAELDVPIDSINTTTPLNASAPGLLGHLPPAPYNFQVRNTNMIIRFQDYRGRLPGGNVAMCLLQAANTVNTNWGTRASIGDARETRWGSVRLKVIPTPRGDLTWEYWGMAIRGITTFVTFYEYVDMDFYILVNGQIVGGGLISDH